MARGFIRCAALLLGVLAGAANAEDASNDVPAIIVHPDDQSRAALYQAVSHALGDAPVTLADDALTLATVLSVHHAHPRDAAGRPFDGREREKPQTFALFRNGTRCILVHLQNGERITLKSVECAAA